MCNLAHAVVSFHLEGRRNTDGPTGFPPALLLWYPLCHAGCVISVWLAVSSSQQEDKTNISLLKKKTLKSRDATQWNVMKIEYFNIPARGTWPKLQNRSRVKHFPWNTRFWRNLTYPLLPNHSGRRMCISPREAVQLWHQLKRELSGGPEWAPPIAKPHNKSKSPLEQRVSS